ncbi:hypothetical protein [Streptomyces sp. NPDC020917]|uniref:hypothetical protein n=1 Tax=Streptomyces sp. NPDC020917 TaxID=3365102 RepID=UPI0037B8898B
MGVLSSRGRRLRPWASRRQPGEDVEVAYGQKLLADGSTVEAERWLRERLTVREGVRKPEPGGLRRVRLALADTLLALNRAEEAAAVLHAARTDADAYRWSRPFTSTALRSVSAFVAILCGRDTEAEAELDAIAAEFHATPAPGPRILMGYLHSRLVVLALLSHRGRFAEALAAADELLPRAAATVGVENGFVDEVRRGRVFVLAMLGRYDEAAAECRALLAPRPGTDGDSDAQDTATLGLAHCLVAQGRSQEAEAAVRGPLDRAERVEGRCSREAVMLRRALAEAVARQGRFEEALALVEGPPAWGVVDAGHHELVRAEALLGLGRREEAEASAAQALAAATVNHAPCHVRILEIRTLLARIRASAQELDAVTADWVTHYGPDHLRTRAAAAR